MLSPNFLAVVPKIETLIQTD